MAKQPTLLALALLCAAAARAQTCTLETSFTTKERLVSANPNSLKLFDVSVDETRSKAWISPIMNDYLTSIDLATLAEGADSLPVEVPAGSPTNVKFILANPANGYVLVIIGGEAAAKLYNPATSALVGTFTFSGNRGGVAVDAANNQFLACDGTSIKFLSGADLSAVGTAINFFTEVGSVEVDATNSKIWAASKYLSSGNVTLKKYNLTTRALEATYSIAATQVMGVQAIDAAHNRLVLGGTTVVKDLNLTTAAVNATYTVADVFDDIAYSNNKQTAYLTCSEAHAAQGLHGKWSKRYEINFPAGTTTTVAPSGDKVSKIAIDQSRELLIEPHMHRGIVTLTNLNTSAKTTLDVGDSADDLCISGDMVFCVNRLGGSRVTAWNAATDAISSFDAGVWPCAVRADAGLGHLFVLDHFTSSIQRRSLASHALIDSVLLGIDEAREDAISHLFLEESTHRLFAVFPELEKMVVVNGSSMTVEATIDLSGWFSHNGAGGLGNLQVAAGAGKIFAYDKYTHRLNRYDATTFADEGYLNLTPNWTGQTMDQAALAWDGAASKLLCGDLIINPTATWTPAAAIETDLNTGGVFAGRNSAGNRRVFIYQSSAGLVTVKFLDATTNALVASQGLFTFVGAPAFLMDAAGDRLFFGEFTTSRIWHYSVSSAPLAVEMSGFEAEFLPEEGRARLLWEVAAEAGTARYVVEKAASGPVFDENELVFSQIGSVAASGRSAYQFFDESPADGWNHYRLRTEDADGKASHSSVAAVFVEKSGGQPVFYPSPATDLLNLDWQGNEVAAWRLFDFFGKKLASGEAWPTGGLDVSGLPPGAFSVQILDENGRPASGRFLKN